MLCALKDYYRRFREWQRTPPAVEPLVDGEQHACLNCGESFDGRYCPRCGQSGRTRRLTPRGVMANALDVWGAGNRSMPRNIIHLLFRPGYMIADYLRGHRQPYFPPFKMLFIFTATLLIMVQVTQWGVGYESPGEQPYSAAFPELFTAPDKPHSEAALHSFEARRSALGKMMDWLGNQHAITVILTQGLVAMAIWLFFRHSKRVPQLTLSEQMFVQVFLSSQMILISAVYFFLSLLWVPGGVDDLPWRFASVVYIADYKQLFGFSWWGTIWRCVLAMVFLALVFLALLILVMLLLYYPFIMEELM